MLVPASWPDIEHIARNMRAIDRKEITGLSPHDDPVEVVRPLQFVPHVGIVAKKDEPIATVGIYDMHPGVASAFMFATDRWPEVAIELTRWVRRKLLPAVARAGYHRVQAYSIADHTVAHNWMERAFGAYAEATLSKYGKHGDDYRLYVLDRQCLAYFLLS